MAMCRVQAGICLHFGPMQGLMGEQKMAQSGERICFATSLQHFG